MVLRGLLEDHKDVIGTLAQGFKESRKHVQVTFDIYNQTHFDRLYNRMVEGVLIFIKPYNCKT